jgi:16S rRNA G966 N2-methylase RsmD
MFRPIQYLGSKFRLLDELSGVLDVADPSGGPVLDLFSGSGVVAAALRRTRTVTAVDIQEYARVLASALLNPEAEGSEELADAAETRASHLMATSLASLVNLEREAFVRFERGDPELLASILEHGAPIMHEAAMYSANDQTATTLANVEIAPEMTLTRYYGGVYFSYEQALRLDCLLLAIRAVDPGSRRDTALAAALGAASESVTSVGSHFAQPLRPRASNGQIKGGALRAARRQRSRDPLSIFRDRLASYAAIEPGDHTSSAVRSDYREYLQNSSTMFSVVYADPPYTRDHYSRFYHVLETMALGDEPEVATVVAPGGAALTRGLYRRERHQSPFSIRSRAVQAFDDLFAGVRARDIPLVLSYSPSGPGTVARPQPRLMTIPALVELAETHFADVSLSSAGQLSHSRFNARHLNGVVDEQAESFLLCRP